MYQDEEVDWHRAEPEDTARSLYAWVTTLEEDQRDLYEKWLRFAWLYDSSRLSGFDMLLSANGEGGQVTENVIESIVDTAKALIAKNRPKATFVTDGGDFSTQRKAKQLERFIEAEFQRVGVYGIGVEIFRDACVTGTGVVKVFAKDGKIACERVPVEELRVDEEECLSGATPRKMAQVKFVDKDVLKALFPEKAEEIDRETLDEDADYWSTSRQLKRNQIAVTEAWYLPSGKGTKDGRWVITAGKETLLQDKPWTKDKFPFVVYHWSKRRSGFFGRGLCEILQGLQLRVNKHNRVISKSQDLFAVPRVLVHVSDGALSAKITNQIGQLIPYKLHKPEFVVNQAVPPELYQDTERKIARMFQISGVSELSASAKKPGGLDSGAALREFNDIETQRFSIQAQDYENFFLEVARHFVAIAKEIYGKTNQVAVWRSRSLIKKINWKDVDLEEDMYQMAIEASSILSRTPAGRLQGVIELAQSQLIEDKAVLLRLLGHPDLEAETDMETAGLEDIEATIEELLDGEFNPPEPFQDLNLGIKRVQQAYLKTRRIKGRPDKVLENMLQWMEQAQVMLAMATPPAQPQMPMGQPGMDPMAAQAPQLQPMSPDMGAISPGAPQGALTSIQAVQGMPAPL